MPRQIGDGRRVENKPEETFGIVAQTVADFLQVEHAVPAEQIGESTAGMRVTGHDDIEASRHRCIILLVSVA